MRFPIRRIPRPSNARSLIGVNWSANRTSGLLDWYRRLIRLRAAIPELGDGKLARVEVTYDEQQRWMVMDRGPISVAVNLGEQARVVAVRTGSRRLLMASDELIALNANGVELPVDSVAIIGPRNTEG